MARQKRSIHNSAEEYPPEIYAEANAKADALLLKYEAAFRKTKNRIYVWYAIQAVVYFRHPTQFPPWVLAYLQRVSVKLARLTIPDPAELYPVFDDPTGMPRLLSRKRSIPREEVAREIARAFEFDLRRGARNPLAQQADIEHEVGVATELYELVVYDADWRNQRNAAFKRVAELHASRCAYDPPCPRIDWTTVRKYWTAHESEFPPVAWAKKSTTRK